MDRVDVNLRTPPFQRTLLHCAVLERDAALVRELLSRGAEVRVRDAYGLSALDYAHTARDLEEGPAGGEGQVGGDGEGSVEGSAEAAPLQAIVQALTAAGAGAGAGGDGDAPAAAAAPTAASLVALQPPLAMIRQASDPGTGDIGEDDGLGLPPVALDLHRALSDPLHGGDGGSGKGGGVEEQGAPQAGEAAAGDMEWPRPSKQAKASADELRARRIRRRALLRGEQRFTALTLTRLASEEYSPAMALRRQRTSTRSESKERVSTTTEAAVANLPPPPPTATASVKSSVARAKEDDDDFTWPGAERLFKEVVRITSRHGDMTDAEKIFSTQWNVEEDHSDDESDWSYEEDENGVLRHADNDREQGSAPGVRELVGRLEGLAQDARNDSRKVTEKLAQETKEDSRKPTPAEADALEAEAAEPTRTDSASASAVDSDFTCAICLEPLAASKRCSIVCPDECGAEPPYCQPCWEQHVSSIVDRGLYSALPVNCPACLAHVSTAVWQAGVPGELANRYNTNCRALLSMRCPGCDGSKSLLVCPVDIIQVPTTDSEWYSPIESDKPRMKKSVTFDQTPNSTLGQVSRLRSILLGGFTATAQCTALPYTDANVEHTPGQPPVHGVRFLRAWRRYIHDEIPANELVQAFDAVWRDRYEGRTAVAHGGVDGVPLAHQFAEPLLPRTVFAAFHDIEKRAAFQLCWLRKYPKTITACDCNQEVCFLCKCYGFHEGRTCPEHQAAQGDIEAQYCPSCNVATIRSEGCTSIMCVCGHYWTWRTEKRGDSVSDYDTSTDSPSTRSPSPSESSRSSTPATNNPPVGSPHSASSSSVSSSAASARSSSPALSRSSNSAVSSRLDRTPEGSPCAVAISFDCDGEAALVAENDGLRRVEEDEDDDVDSNDS